MQRGERRVDILGVVGGIGQRGTLAPAFDGRAGVGAADELHQYEGSMAVHAPCRGHRLSERQVDLDQPGGLEPQRGP